MTNMLKHLNMADPGNLLVAYKLETDTIICRVINDFGDIQLNY